MKNKKIKDMMVLGGSIMASMAAGIVVGMVKEKMMNKTKCIIDEL